MKKICTLFLILVMKFSSAQVIFNNAYSKQDFDYSNAVIERYDGKYLIAGSSRSQFVTDYDVNVILVDSAGNLIWDKYIGQSPRMEVAYSIVETIDSNYVLGGDVIGSIPYLLKIDTAGNMIWEKSYVSPLYSYGSFSIGQSFEGNFYFLRNDTSTLFFVTNSSGDSLYSKRYDYVMLKSVVQTRDSGYIMIGDVDTSVINDRKICLLKTDSIGDTLWRKTFGGPGYDIAASVQQLSDDGYIIAGNFDTQIIDGESETFIIRTNSIGDTIWTKHYYLGESNHIKVCKNNNGYILSSKRYMFGGLPFLDKYFVIITKLDTLGNIEWTRDFDGYSYELGNNVVETSDGCFLLTGFVDYGLTFADAILIKVDSVGNFVLSVPNEFSSKPSKVLSFPNPATDEINFVIGESNIQIEELKVFNAFGQKVKTILNINDHKIKVKLNFLNSGIYFYELRLSDNKIEAGKFIVN